MREAGDRDSAVSRAYYAAFYLAEVLLDELGLTYGLLLGGDNGKTISRPSTNEANRSPTMTRMNGAEEEASRYADINL